MDALVQERFAQALHNTARAWRLALDRRLKELGLSQAGWLTIAAVNQCSTLTQTELASKLGVEGPTMVAMIDRLVKSGHLVRVLSERDRRVRLVELTALGRGTYSQIYGIAALVRKEFLGGIDHKQLEPATFFLESLKETIEANG